MSLETQPVIPVGQKALNSPNYLHFGIDSSLIVEKTTSMEEGSVSRYEHIQSQHPKAELTRMQAEKLSYAERVTRQYLKEKITSYGLDASYIDDLPIDYVTSLQDQPHAGGYHVGNYGYTCVVVRPNTWTVSHHAAHELSHASAKHTIAAHWNSEGDVIKAPCASGFEQLTKEGEVIGRGLENAFAIIDEVEIIKRTEDIFPEEKAKRSIGRLHPIIQLSLEEVNNSNFGPISTEDIVPIIQLEGKTKVGLGLVITPAYLLIREIGRVVGHDLYKQNLNMASYTESQIISEGIRFLDKCRYTDAVDGKLILESVFGKEATDLLFSLADYNLNGYDEAMRMVREKEREMGMLPKSPMSDEPLGWDQYF